MRPTGAAGGGGEGTPLMERPFAACVVVSVVGALVALVARPLDTERVRPAPPASAPRRLGPG